MEEKYQQAAKVLAQSQGLLICAGAGMGVDSGLPDFRGDEGFWKAYPPLAKLGLSFSEMANPRWFEHDPELAWGFYGHRLMLYRETQPHAGFGRLLDFCKGLPHGCFVFTSNVDGQFQKAGFEPESVYECHGSIHHLQTLDGSGQIWLAKGEQIDLDPERFRARPPLPKAPGGSLARPNILMFGDWYWNSERADIQQLAMQNWFHELREAKAKIAVLEMGAGKSVPTVRLHAEKTARHFEATLIRVNPRQHQVREDIKHISIEKGALEAIEGIFKHFK